MPGLFNLKAISSDKDLLASVNEFCNCGVISIASLVVCRCKTCGEYIYKGKKFNARKETVQNELYMGLPIFRFYIKCTRCLAEITFKVIITVIFVEMRQNEYSKGKNTPALCIR